MKVSPGVAMHSNLSAPVLGSALAQPAPADTSSPRVSISRQGRALSMQAAGLPDSTAPTDIMAGVSLRHIRYTDLVALADKLRDAGHLAEQDYLDFIGPSPEFSMVDGTRNPAWDVPTDYIGRHEMNIAFMTATGAEQRFIDFEKHLLSLYKSFESCR